MHLVACILPGQDAQHLSHYALAHAKASRASCTVISLEDPGDPAVTGSGELALDAALARARSEGADVHRLPLQDLSASSMLDAARPWLQKAQRTVLMLARQPDPLFASYSSASGLAELCADDFPNLSVKWVRKPPPSQCPLAHKHRRASWRPLLETLGLLGITSVIAQLASARLTDGHMDLVYLAGATLIALRHGALLANVFVIAGLLIYNLLVLEPFLKLAPMDSHQTAHFIVMVLIGSLIGLLTSVVRTKSLEADERMRRMLAANDLSYALAQAVHPAEVELALRSAVDSALGGQAELLIEEQGSLQTPEGGNPLLALESQARLALRSGRNLVEGTRPTTVYLVLRGTSEAFGLLVVRTADALNQDGGDADLLEAFASHAAVVLQRQRLEAAQAVARLETETERVRSTLLAAVSHDFRSPLSTIVGTLEQLLSSAEELPARQRKAMLLDAHRDACRLQQRMSKLLDLTRLDEGAVSVQPEWCPVEELLTEVVNQQRTHAQTHRLRVQTASDAMLWCDPRLIEQFLDNLLENALRHTPPDTVVELLVEPAESGMRIVLQDSGPGFPADTVQEVQARYQRGTAQWVADAGLGLSICAVIAHLHRAELRLENRGGARVELRLPQPVFLMPPEAADA